MAMPDKHQQEARRIAMLKAMETMKQRETQFCSNCAALESKFSVENKRSCQEIQHLRQAVQKMIDQLAAYMSTANLRAFAGALRLDERIFTIPNDMDVYRSTPFPVEDQVSRQELKQIEAERDIAKMKLFALDKEMKELKVEYESLSQGRSDQDKAAIEQARRLDSLEKNIAALERQPLSSDVASCGAAQTSWEKECSQARPRQGLETFAIGPDSQAPHARRRSQQSNSSDCTARIAQAEAKVKTLQATLDRKADLSIYDFGNAANKTSPSGRLTGPTSGNTRSQPNLWTLSSQQGRVEQRSAVPLRSFDGLKSSQKLVLSKGRSSGLVTFKYDGLPGLT